MTNSHVLSAQSHTRRHHGAWIARLVLYILLALFMAFYLFPLIVMIMTSVKPMAEIRLGNMIRPPQSLTFEPWEAAWSSACVGVECVGIRGFYKNTFLMVIPSVVISTLIGALNGFALTKFKFRGHHLVFGLIMFGCFTPHQSILIPMAITLGKLGLSGTLWGLILVHTVYGLPFTTLFFRNFYVNIPQELISAAKIDGAGFLLIFTKILLPISLPIVVVSIIWQFTNIWNDFLFGASFTYGANAPIMVALNNIVNTSTGESPYNINMASAIMAAIPTLAVYVLAGKYFIRGLMAGSVKG